MAKLMRGMLKSAVVAKAYQIIKREAAKPENQRRAKELFAKVTRRGTKPRAA